jgi:hypothetical protein
MRSVFDSDSYTTVEVETEEKRPSVWESVRDFDRIFPLSIVLLVLTYSLILVVLTIKPFIEVFPNADSSLFRVLSACVFFICSLSGRVHYKRCYQYVVLVMLSEIVSCLILWFTR